MELILPLLALVGINGFMAYSHYNKYYKTPSIGYSMKSISKVYDILTLISTVTTAHKVTIGKACYKCDSPYFELLYDNNRPDEERYNVKYNRMTMDENLIKTLKSVAKGASILTKYDDLPKSVQREIYRQEGIRYSEIYKVIMVDQFLYVLILHHKNDSYQKSDKVITKHLNRLINIFKRNKRNL